MKQAQAKRIETGVETASDAFDSLAFRRALGQFATGVVIVSAHDPAGEPIGLTVSSFNSVSLSPPLVLFSVARGALSLPALSAADGYAVSVLSHRQEDLSRRFSRRLDGGKWAAAPHALSRAKAPLIHDTLARFECEPYATYDGGDHVIFVGRVVGFEVEDQHQPLVFFRGGYHSLKT